MLKVRYKGGPLDGMEEALYSIPHSGRIEVLVRQPLVSHKFSGEYNREIEPSEVAVYELDRCLSESTCANYVGLKPQPPYYLPQGHFQLTVEEPNE